MPAPPRKLLLIGWDSADWKLLSPLMESRQMPALARLVKEGCRGQISTLHPVYSPMLWTSIATGKRPYKHGVLGFSEPLPDRSGVRPVSSLSRKTKAFWNVFHQQGWRGHVVGWWPSHPAEPINGCMVSNLCHHATGPEDQEWPLPPNGVHPAAWHDTLAELRVHPNDFGPEHIEPFIPQAREIDQDMDRRLAGCMKTLAECATVHSWAMHLVENTQWDYMAVYYDAMDHFGHGFMKYHPPRREMISEKDFDLYSGVMAQGARFHDMMLAALLSKVPPDTTVVLLSDHGFHPGEGRPGSLAPIPAGPAEEHSDFGIFVIRGPGIKKDHLIQGTSVLDIAPTLLTLQGLPVGVDMDGRTALDAFAEAPAVQTIPSWDAVPGDDGSHPGDLKSDPASEQAALEQLIALGYVQRPSDNVGESVKQTQRELDMNLAEALIDGGRETEALPILRELCAGWPGEWRFHLRRAMACKALGRVDELREVVEGLQARRGEVEAARTRLKELTELYKPRFEARRAELKAYAEKKQAEATPDAESVAPTEEEKALRAAVLSAEEQTELKNLSALAGLNTHGLDYLRAIVALSEKQPRRALDLLAEAGKGMTRRPGLYLQIGESYQRLAQWHEAEAAFQKALALDPENPHAFTGLARCYLARRFWPLAAASALKATNLLHHYPLAHFLLGLALMRLGDPPRAATAWHETLKLNPNFWPAHLRLARLAKLQKDEALCKHHLAEARRLRQQAIAIANGEMPAHQEAEPRRTEVTDQKPENGAFTFAPELLGSPRAPFERPITIVTGLPRSGTSLLMQMLAAGGFELLTDGTRAADEDNPRGYFEVEAVKSLRDDNSILNDADGKAVKVILPLLVHLLPDKLYHVLLIERDLDEIFASQRTMIQRHGGAAHDPQTLRPAYERLLKQGRQMLDATPIARTLRLSHRWLMENPGKGAGRIAAFLGSPLNCEAMAAEIEPALHRQRNG